MRGKSCKECIQFYYLWKKICPDDYKRLRIVRRKKEQAGYFYSQSVKTAADDELVDGNEALEDTASVLNGQFCDASSNHCDESMDCDEEAELGLDILTNSSDRFEDSLNPSPAASSVGSLSLNRDCSNALVDYPCRICGKTFNKVKSRSAHMKVHALQSRKVT